MIIRTAQPDDFKSIAEIYSASKLDELKFERARFELLPLERDERRLGALLESEIFVCEIDNVVAYGALFGNEIRGLFVNPNERGKGVGTSLLRYMLARAEYPARLFVAKTNTPAKVLYERHGFEVTNEFETSYNGLPVLANEMTLPAPMANLSMHRTASGGR